VTPEDIDRLMDSPTVRGFLAVWERHEYGVDGHADECDCADCYRFTVRKAGR
jgi:hypothetical protein